MSTVDLAVSPVVPPVPAMAREAAQAADAALRQIRECASGFAELGARLRKRPPHFIVTCARGSSDHAASYGKYLLETNLGRAVASMGPSVASVYNTPNLELKDSLFIAVSQSGRSPDLLRLTEAARAGGALTIGFVNAEGSPLSRLCDVNFPLCAGPEHSVAATKSYILSGLAFLQLAAHWTQEAGLHEAVSRLPAALEAARALDWWPGLSRLADARSLFVLGRGSGLGAALEMALKFKETCRLHAEAFSTAEVSHGPLALVGPGFPVLALGQEDGSAEGTRSVVRRMVELGAEVRSALEVPGAELLPTVPGVPNAIAPLCQVQSFYMAVHRLATARRLDPDAPAHLRKVTETV
ncbi:SIS domain-containing protein [Stigmatella aurantiaca]|uniref:Glutamine-fructose-6-phosphate transaminase (Isomerizing) n=1 Tax=Stigmatella aurantiaca (strain DW4/3-1) TaxID=378806 RepID=E3FMW5_STIAD|nr:SIS domain-containing protein [Stigmatella aurantiaca]ADO73080.1 Glutamine-fructose-6-phosphate transaminase (Isomerizing) [Stigmatella aurantiaca DW4/3-1]